ncbi:MAG: hypothetical protein KME31_20765 [Tolypothrix carrinoi HA7290-LM1]|jgi:hypothetical protein|nr:hypothetical protein [Tolypothrix carrinoi HA7290-LM1]
MGHGAYQEGERLKGKGERYGNKELFKVAHADFFFKSPFPFSLSPLTQIQRAWGIGNNSFPFHGRCSTWGDPKTALPPLFPSSKTLSPFPFPLSPS